MSEKFKVFPGKFTCKKCNEEVNVLRLWLETADVTWMCSQKHISKVPLILTRKDYERKI
jgi:hypothetical protein